MNDFIKHIEKILKKDARLWSKDDDKKLLKNKLVEIVSNDDEALLELLLEDSEAKKHFFKIIKNSAIFLKDRFLQFVTMNEFLPDSFTAFENEIGLSNDTKLITQKDDISLIFPHKDCILEGGQTKEEAGREEIFYNTILAPDEIDRIKEPKALANWKRFDKDGKHEVREISKQDNLVIKGNNLLALYSLLPKYRGEIKLIYIDPPYNTNTDSFKYNDRFNHSAWLIFMQNRLEIARELLAEDGVIFVQCDDSEQAYLKVLLDQVFKNGFINCIAVKMSEATGVKMSHSSLRFPKIKEYLLLYKKGNFKGFVEIDKYKQEVWDKENNIFLENFTQEQRSDIAKLEEKETNDESDVEKAVKILKGVKKISLSEKIKTLGINSYEDLENWKFENAFRIIKTAGSSSLAKLVKSLSNKLEQDVGAGLSKEKVLFFYITDFNKDTAQPRLRVIFADSNIYKNPCDFWQDIKTSGAISDEGGVKLENGKKPEKLLERIIKMTTTNRDIVLDFFAGAGTTGAVAHKMGRRYILVEQMDYIHDLPEARLINVINGDQTGISKSVNWKGGGSFVYTELLEWNQKYISQLEKAKTEKEVLGIYKEIEKEQFYKYKYEPTKFDSKKFKELSIEEQKKALLDILDMNHLYVNKSSINDTTFKVTEEDKKLTKMFYEEK